ncbi:GPP34 family phosphoprotein [Solwaraspora sp. WMMD937]|uniref:GOLPH3/VPS74 family protein n=1 Tax=Solwaraspora sp. WMMD937 TaxID=3016090 RepID=UPI00249A2900|nr:GPP34 family phosphoprotein [Solwaraspora sp. WMMD937]WFE22702.1 GPP34 family phosphoprotein [Solwaraspora sp. WMMD937]
MESLSLAEELVLLSYDDSGTATVASPELDYAVAGAVLCDLAVGGQIAIDADGRVLTDDDPAGGYAPGDARGRGHGRELLDQVRTRIQAEPGRATRDWVVDLSHGVVDEVLNGLVVSGVLRRERDRVLWVLPRPKFAPPDGGEPPAETETRRRLAAAERGAGPVGPRTAALACLLNALDVPNVAVAQPLDARRRPPAVLGPAAWPIAATTDVVAGYRATVARSVFAATDVATGS